MCDSNPTRRCTKGASEKLITARRAWERVSKDPHSVDKEEILMALTHAENEFDETRGGQRRLANMIKTAQTSEAKESLLKRKNEAIDRRKDKNKQSVINLGKTCRKCKTLKTSDNFASKMGSHDRFQNVCKSCQMVINSEYYAKTPEKNDARKAHKTQRVLLISQVINPLLEAGCADCHKYYENAMDFDHIDGAKVMNISSFAGSNLNDVEMIAALNAEIAKCEVRCSNCHRIATFERQKRNSRLLFLQDATKVSQKHQYVYTKLLNSSCIDCNNSDFRVLEFDHVRGSKKENVSRMMTKNWSYEEIDEEISKCEVRCANCHRMMTTNRARGISSTLQSIKYKPTSKDLLCSCGNSKTYGTKTCSTCYKAPKIRWIETPELIELLRVHSFEELGRQFGVSGNAVRKHLSKLGIDPKTVTKNRNL